MSRPSDDDAAPLVAIAKATRTRGLKGELVADLLTDFPARFESVTALVAVAPNGERRPVELEEHWFQNDRVILKLKGYDDLESAGGLVGFEFAVPEDERVPLESGSFYDWELQGCAVELLDGKSIGTATGVIRTGGVEVLAVNGENGREYLVPMVETIVLSIDIGAKRIVIDPPEGLLEL